MIPSTKMSGFLLVPHAYQRSRHLKSIPPDFLLIVSPIVTWFTRCFGKQNAFKVSDIVEGRVWRLLIPTL